MKTKIINTHDWIRLTINDGKDKISLTYSRYKDTCSGTIDKDMLNRALWGFSVYRQNLGNTEFKNLGELVKSLEKQANELKTINGFVNRLYSFAKTVENNEGWDK